MSFAPLCSTHRAKPTREPFSAYASRHVRILDFCFEPSGREGLYVPISWSNKKFPVVTSRLLTVCPLGWQRESEGNIGRRSCHTPISALMSHIKRCPYLNVILKGKNSGRCPCVWRIHQKKEKEKQLIKTYKQASLFYCAELLIRFAYLKVPDARIAVHFKVLCVWDCVFCRDASCQAEIIDF